MFMLKTRENLIQELFGVSLWDIPLLRKVTNVIILLRGNFMSVDVTFFEKEPYFSTPYLQGETSLMENKDRDLFLLELSFSPFVQLESQSGPSHES